VRSLAHARRVRAMTARARRLLAAGSVAVLAAGAAGCGNERSAAPDVSTPGPPLGSIDVSYPKFGIEFIAPKGWTVTEGSGTLVTTVQTGQATVAIWRYPREEPLPATAAAMRRARKELIAAAKRRDKTFKVGTSRIIRLRKAPAIQLVGRETIGGKRFRVRSTHIFAHGAEIVVDGYAPPKFFPDVDKQVFKKVLRSLRITKPKPEKKKK
jgi:hypothetical protein